MKKQKKQNRYQEKVDWDDMTIGELSHHIGKKMTEKVVKSKKTYTRKTKHKNKGISSDGYGLLAPKSYRFDSDILHEGLSSVRTLGFHPEEEFDSPTLIKIHDFPSYKRPEYINHRPYLIHIYYTN